VQGLLAGGAADGPWCSEVSASEGVDSNERFSLWWCAGGRLGGGGRESVEPAEAGGKGGHVVGDHVQAQPGGVGGEPSGWEVVEPDAVFEVSDGVLDHRVAAVVGLQEHVSPARLVMNAW
jgi:hypothetical protein